MGRSLNVFFIISSTIETQVMSKRFVFKKHNKTAKSILGFQFLLCLFLFIPFSFSATTLHSDSTVADQISLNNSPIYISAGGNVIGSEHIYIADAKLEKVKTPKESAEKPVLSSENLSKDRSKEKEALAKKYPTAKPVYIFESTESKSQLAFGAARSNMIALNFNPHKLKFSPVAIDKVNVAIIFNYDLKNQKFYTSISDLLFDIYGSSSLRAPPAYS